VFELLKSLLQVVFNNEIFVSPKTNFKLVNLLFSQDFHQSVILQTVFVIFLLNVLQDTRTVLFLGDSVVVEELSFKD
jgi:hypothetical protein